MSEPLLKVRDLRQYFPVPGGRVFKAVNGVSFDIYPGETYGLVGESGSGKTTIGRSVIRLYKPTEGSVCFDGQEIAGRLDRAGRERLRENMQMIFQDPMSSLNPRKRVGDIIGEGLDIHRRAASRAERSALVAEMLEKVGLSSAHADRYPHQFSGGQRQRVGIARALALNPELIVCDEPVSALDVSIQAQILNLLADLQQQRSLTYLFISHDLNVVRYLPDRVIVMFLGKFCELAPTQALYAEPRHPYTRFLLEAVPVPDPTRRDEDRALLTGEVSSPVNPPDGCRFHPRCPCADEQCRREEPALRALAPGHFCACHHPITYSQKENPT